MEDIQSATQELVDEVLEFLEESPLPNLSKLIYHDELYEACNEFIFNNLATQAEQQAEEDKYKDYDDERYRTQQSSNLGY